jgi:D-psicose/D-tagatose/L-ribulose 3-epimerase
MDIGIHLSLWTQNWNDPFIDFIDTAAGLGFDSVELPLMDPDSLPAAEIKDRLERNSLGVYCGTGLGPATDISSPDAKIRAAGLKHLRKCLETAEALGSRSLGGVIHSAWGKKGGVPAEERRHSAAALRVLADMAADLGMRIALECINRYESSFLNTVEQGMELLSMIDRENAGLHLDTYHMNIEERSFEEAFKLASGSLFHLHLSENHRGYPGSGLLDWSRIIDLARAYNYNGPWVIESYVEPGTSQSNDVFIWRDIEPDSGESLKKSLDMLRKVGEK